MEKIIIDIINSNSFTGFATIFTGVIALLVFLLQKNNEKTQAARMIIGEIRNAEAEIKRIKDSHTHTTAETPIFPQTPILPQNSWNKFSHLFTKDLDQDEINLVNKFYASVELIQQNVQRFYNSIPLQADKKLEAIQGTLVYYASTLSEEEYKDRKKKFLDIIGPEGFCPLPNLYKENILKYLNNVDLVLTTSAGKKLKEIAGI